MTERHLNSKQVLHICGDVSTMSLWRWQKDPSIGFPTPIYVGRRRLWPESAIAEWLASRTGAQQRAA